MLVFIADLRNADTPWWLTRGNAAKRNAPRQRVRGDDICPCLAKARVAAPPSRGVDPMPDSFAAWCGHLPQAAAAWCGQVLGYPEELAADPVSFTVRVGPFVAAALILIVLVWKRRARAGDGRASEPATAHARPALAAPGLPRRTGRARPDHRHAERAVPDRLVLHAGSLRSRGAEPQRADADRSRRAGRRPLFVPGIPRHSARAHPCPHRRVARPRVLGARLRPRRALAAEGARERRRAAAGARPRSGAQLSLRARPDRAVRPAVDPVLPRDLLPVPSAARAHSARSARWCSFR